LKDLIAEINDAERELAQQGMEAEVFTIYWMLHRQYGMPGPQARRVADELVHTFAQHPHWATNRRQEQALYRALFRVLYGHMKDPKALPRVVDHLMRVLRHHHG